MKPSLSTGLVAGLFLLLAACNGPGQVSPATQAAGSTAGSVPQAAKPVLTVSILPQAFLVQRIAGDGFAVNVLVGEGQSPHSYEPSPRQMASLATSAAWFRIRVDFENGLAPKVAALYPALPVVDVTPGITWRTMEAHSHEAEAGHQAEGSTAGQPGPADASEAEEHHDEAGTPDQHVWLGEANTLVMADNVRDTLSRLFPDQAALFQANHDALATEVKATFAQLRSDLAPLRGQTVYVFHPAFGYLLDELGLHQEAVETGGKEPSQKALADLITRAKADKVRTIFVQAQFPAAAATTLADSLGAVVVPLDPLAPDLLDNLRRIGAALNHGFTN